MLPCIVSHRHTRARTHTHPHRAGCDCLPGPSCWALRVRGCPPALRACPGSLGSPCSLTGHCPFPPSSSPRSPKRRSSGDKRNAIQMHKSSHTHHINPLTRTGSDIHPSITSETVKHTQRLRHMKEAQRPQPSDKHTRTHIPSNSYPSTLT